MPLGGNSAVVISWSLKRAKIAGFINPGSIHDPRYP